MGWTKMINLIKITLGLCVLLLAQGANAQDKESAWRVINQASVTIVPNFKGEENPFPIKFAPKVEVVEEIDYEALARAEKRASLIKELRDIIRVNDAYQASFGTRKLRGRIKGRDGEKVLIGRDWLKVGSTFEVSVGGVSDVLSKLDALKEIDPKSAAAMEKQLRTIIPSGDTIVMKIIDITTTEVLVKDSLGKDYTLQFE